MQGGTGGVEFQCRQCAYGSYPASSRQAYRARKGHSRRGCDMYRVLGTAVGLVPPPPPLLLCLPWLQVGMPRALLCSVRMRARERGAGHFLLLGAVFTLSFFLRIFSLFLPRSEALCWNACCFGRAFGARWKRVMYKLPWFLGVAQLLPPHHVCAHGSTNFQVLATLVKLGFR